MKRVVARVNNDATSESDLPAILADREFLKSLSSDFKSMAVSVTGFILSDPHFINAFKSVPDSDVARFLLSYARVNVGSRSTVKEREEARCTIAYLYRSNPCCNVSGCKDKYGKETFSRCPKCKRKFCCQKCHLGHVVGCSTQLSNDNFSGCNACDARPQSLIECEKCYLAFYCCQECKAKDAASHAKRCCVSDAPPDTGPMALTLVNLKNDIEGAKKEIRKH